MKNEKGYSLLELTVVMSILSFCYLSAAPVIEMQLQKQQTRLLLNQIGGDLYGVSNEARTHNTIASLVIFRYQHFYLLTRTGRGSKKRTLPTGYTISSNFNQDRIQFYGDGQISQAGTITLKDPDGRAYQVVVQLSSGRFWVNYG